MEEVTSDLKRLIRIQRQRPAFARTISWEFSRSEEEHRKCKSKRKTKQKLQDDVSGSELGDNVDDDVIGDTGDASLDEVDNATRQHRLSIVESVGDSGSSDESEYYSALEDEFDESVATDDTFETLDSLEESTNKKHDTLDNNTGDLEHSSVSSELAAAASSKFGVCDGGRRRRPSKKQRKKRNREFRVTFVNEIMSLANVFDVTEDIDIAVSELTEGDSSVCINREVPSLVQLCMAVTSRKVESKDKAVLPVGMRKLVSGWNQKQGLLRKQLSWLQNRLLSISENETNFSSVWKIFVDKSSSTQWLFLYPTKSVWNAIPFPIRQHWNQDQQYTSGKAASFLPAFSLNSKKQNENIHWEYNNFCTYDCLQPLCNLSALASAIDLMLPAFVTERSLGERNVAEQELFSKGLKTMLIRVKLALKARFPRIVEEFYDRALPYVMWARGNVTLATEMFNNLILKEKRARHKAMHLSEIGRMNCEFDETETAVKFYRLAGEMAVGKPKHTDKDIAEVTEQTQVLVASVHDNGALTPEKARQSSACWNGALNLPKQRQATAVMAVESFMCYHAANWTDSSWLEEALTKIRNVEKTLPYLKYHASMLLALQNKDSESRQKYKESLNSSSATPGQELLSILNRRKIRNAWQPLLDIVAQNKTTLKPLNVVWRRQLGAPQITSNERPEEAQICMKDLNLHINEDGYLVADIQNILPPQRDISLDLYTGSPVVIHVPSLTATLHTSALEADKPYRFKTLHIPTPQLLYSDESGTKVHIMKPGVEACTKYISLPAGTPPEPFVISWQNASGQRAKINVVQALKSAMKERCLIDIRKRLNWAEAKMTKISELLQVYLDNNRAFDVYELERTYNNIERREKADKKKKAVANRSKKHYLKNAKPLSVKWDRRPRIYGHTILLQLLDHVQNKYVMCINTKDKESFQRFNLRPNNAGDVLAEQCSIKCLPQQGEFCIMYNKTGVNIYNENGVLVNRLADVKDENVANPCVIGPNLYMITKDRLSVWKHMIGVEESFDDEVRLLERNTNTSWVFAEYWSLLPEENKQIQRMWIVGQQTGNLESFLMIHTSVGLCFMDPGSFNLLPVSVETKSPPPYAQSEDGKMLLFNGAVVKLRAEKTYITEGRQITKLAVAVENNILVFEINKSLSLGDSRDSTAEVKLIMCVALPGFAVEACFVGKEVGILVAVTMYVKDADYYRQNLFYFKLDGHCYGLLPCLGRGKRSFCPVYLHGDGGQGQPGWHVYMRDGHNGIICVRLRDSAL